MQSNGVAFKRNVLLVREGYQTDRTHVSTLMKRMGIEVIYRKPGTIKKHHGHQVYLYLLRNRDIRHANQVWVLDTTYIPMARGFVYLTVVLDWATRKVMAAKVAITLEACSDESKLTAELNAVDGNFFTRGWFSNAWREGLGPLRS